MSGNSYFYDDLTGHIVYIKDNTEIEKHLNKYREIKPQKNVFDCETKLNDIHNHLINEGNGFRQLILEITTKCNFRCKYCTYSDNYDFTRPHGSSFMTFETAKLAVDYYMENFEKVHQRNFERVPMISFYGGEPLINFDLIKNIVTYLNDSYKKYKGCFHFYTTTNGYLLNEEIQDFLYKNKFNVLVSIDGYKENHDRNRLLVNGLPTFDKVYKNYINFKKNYPDASVYVSACYDYKTDMNKLVTEVDNTQVDVLRASLIADSDKYYKQFSQSDRETFAKNFQKLKDRFFEQAIAEKLDKEKFLYKFFIDVYGSFAYHRMINEDCPSVKPCTNTCVPGEKIYVESDGNFIICEKLNNREEIGNVFQGLNYDKIAGIMKKYNSAMAGKCNNCSISRLCTLCFKDFCGEKTFCFDDKKCKRQNELMKNLLVDYVNLLEQNPKLFEEITTDYYSKMALVGGDL